MRSNFEITDNNSDAASLPVQLKMMMGLLEVEDPVLSNHLVEHDIDPEFFALKWFGTLFTQTLLLPDVIRFWDTMFCAEPGHRQEYFVAATVGASQRAQRARDMRSDLS